MWNHHLKPTIGLMAFRIGSTFSYSRQIDHMDLSHKSIVFAHWVLFFETVGFNGN